MDPVGARLLQRIQGLLATPPRLEGPHDLRPAHWPTHAQLVERVPQREAHDERSAPGAQDRQGVWRERWVSPGRVGARAGRGRRDAAGDLRRDQRARSGAFAFLRSVITGCQRRRIWHRRRRFPRGRREYHRIKRIASEAETPVGTGTDAERRIERRLPLLDSVPMKPCKPSATITVALSCRQ
jgi:hypothetical protein